MFEVDEYILNQTKAKQELLMYLHDLLINRFDLKPRIRYKIPFYDANKWVAYLNADNMKGVELAFPNAYLFEKYKHYLESKDRKMVRSIFFESLEDIDENVILNLIKEALRIDKVLAK